MRKWKWIGIGSILVIAAMLITVLVTPPLRSAITQISGLAVAQSSIQWNNVKDAAVGDAQTNGLMANGMYVYDPTGAVWNRMRGTAAGVINVSVDTSGTSFYAIKRDNIAAVSQNLAFGFTSKKVVIECPGSNTDEVVIDWLGGAAVAPAANTAGDDRVAPGRTIILDNYAVTSISVIAASGTQTVYVRAFN